MASEHLYNENKDPDLRLRGSKCRTLLLKIISKFSITLIIGRTGQLPGYLTVLLTAVQEH
jgi:hypothetical protein